MQTVQTSDSVDMVTNEPFSVQSLEDKLTDKQEQGKQEQTGETKPKSPPAFLFKVIGLGQALAKAARWFVDQRIETIRTKARVFSDDPEAMRSYKREELAMIPEGDALNREALRVLVGDESFQTSRGEKGNGPMMDRPFMVDLICSACTKGDKTKLVSVLEQSSILELLRLAYRVVGILDDRGMKIAEEGGAPPKKES